jgi:hypothetical protein
VQLLPEWSPTFAGLCLYYPANRHPPAALRLFADAVRAWGERQLSDERSTDTRVPAKRGGAKSHKPETN